MTLCNIISHPSPNFSDRVADEKIDMIVMHYTGMQNGKEALARLCDTKHEVSSHYLIEEDGRIFSLVDESKKAWHAGRSYWRGKENSNSRSIGIEIVNPGHEFGYREFPKIQMEAVLWLAKDIINRNQIEASLIVAHSDIAPERKQDPGELFPWQWLAENGIGLWVNPDYQQSTILLEPGVRGSKVSKLKRDLKEYGYKTSEDDVFDNSLAATIIAFKRHFCPLRLNYNWDLTAEICLKRLLEHIK